LSQSHDHHNKTILVVDDDESLSLLFGYTLELYGYQRRCFTSSLQALDAFTLSPDDFDLIFSDQTMPELTGLEMVKKMRAARPDIPAIIVTGFSDTLDDVSAKENNIVLLNKPLPKNLLLQSVNRILNINNSPCIDLL
jgi:DNA-binding NtrC family response regulator